jgi:hypothetical protein
MGIVDAKRRRRSDPYRGRGERKKVKKGFKRK